jgi:hypothetical protein
MLRTNRKTFTAHSEAEVKEIIKNLEAKGYRKGGLFTIIATYTNEDGNYVIARYTY